MPLVVAGATLCNSRCQRKNWLGSVECLNLAFLIDTKHHGFDWIDIKSHNVACLFDKQRVSRKFERFLAMWFQAKNALDPAHSRLQQLRFLSH